MARNKYLPNGTTYTLDVPHTIHEFNPGKGWEVTDYPVGTTGVIIGRHRRRDAGYEGQVEYKVQLGDGKVFYLDTFTAHLQKGHPSVA